MGDLGGLTSQLFSSSFGRNVKLGVPCLDAACTVGLNWLSVARNLDKPTQKKLKTKEKISNSITFCHSFHCHWIYHCESFYHLKGRKDNGFKSILSISIGNIQRQLKDTENVRLSKRCLGPSSLCDHTSWFPFAWKYRELTTLLTPRNRFNRARSRFNNSEINIQACYHRIISTRSKAILLYNEVYSNNSQFSLESWRCWSLQSATFSVSFCNLIIFNRPFPAICS